MNNSADEPVHNTPLTELYRYGVVGIVSNAAGYSFYLLVTHFGITPKIAISILYLVIAVFGYLGNRKFTFSCKKGFRMTGPGYIVVHCFGYLINLLILYIMVDIAGFDHRLVQATAIFLVASLIFVSLKYIIFKK